MSENLQIGSEIGKPKGLRFNVAAKYRIDFESGTYIEGVLPANSVLMVCSQGDITRFDVWPELPGGPLRIVGEE
jgi:hypothetical protein